MVRFWGIWSPLGGESRWDAKSDLFSVGRFVPWSAWLYPAPEHYNKLKPDDWPSGVLRGDCGFVAQNILSNHSQHHWSRCWSVSVCFILSKALHHSLEWTNPSVHNITTVQSLYLPASLFHSYCIYIEQYYHILYILWWFSTHSYLTLTLHPLFYSNTFIIILILSITLKVLKLTVLFLWCMR